ncbi:MAG: histidine--tRNA ligase [Clostridia bacterium]|nr:histidine--tRNA ligase [Clostridia bacterium]
MSDKIITPKTLSGFVEMLPNEQILFNKMKDTIRQSYELFGFVPLDCPVMDSSQVILAKAGGETEKQIYQLTKGDTDYCLKFDNTVPLAKYVAQKGEQLCFPYRAYQIAKVYRGERPQKGRYREFYQCDIDIVGRDTLDIFYDAEIPSIIYYTFDKLNIGKFTINISNRKLLNGLFEYLNLNEKSGEILRIIDKLDKIGIKNVKDTLAVDYKLNDKTIKIIVDFIEINGNNDKQISKIKALNIDNETFNAGLEELQTVINQIKAFGVPDECVAINLSITRGQDYYTGTIYETYLDSCKEIGSVCSGGRYDNLAKFYSAKNYPGVGISIGLTRLFFQLLENNIINLEQQSPIDVMILPMTENIDYANTVAKNLRRDNIRTILSADTTKLKNKLNYANKMNVPFVIFVGESEIETNTVTVKNMVSGEQVTTEINNCKNIIKKYLEI